MKRFTAACAQFAIKPMDVAYNLEKSVHWIEKAVKENAAELIVLPETVTTGFTPDVGIKELWNLVDEFPGKKWNPILQVAKQLKVYVVLPTYERGPEPNTVYNSAALVSPEGEILGVYRKTHLFPTERVTPSGGWSTPGYEPVVVETPLGNIGLTICYDGDFPELYRAEAVMGAEVICRPSALLRTYDIWELTNKARAYDNHVYMLSCNSVGPDAGGTYFFGHSMIVSPIAQVQALARGTEEIVAVSLDPDPIKKVTFGAETPMIFDHLQDRNLKAYSRTLDPAWSKFEPARRIKMQ